MFVYYLNALLELYDGSVPDVCILFDALLELYDESVPDVCILFDALLELYDGSVPDVYILQALLSFGDLKRDLGVLSSLPHIVAFNYEHYACTCRQFPSTHITDKSFIKLQTKLKPFYILHCGDTPAADREVQFVSDIDVAECISPMKMCLRRYLI